MSILVGDNNNRVPEMAYHISPKCYDCFDSGLVNNQKTLGVITRCFNCYDSLFFSPAALKFQNVVLDLQKRGKEIDQSLFFLAQTLTPFTSETPVKRLYLQKWLKHTDERQTKRLLARLQDEWLLPIGSRKHEPFGHWIITTETDFREWRREARQSAITRLATIHRVEKHNFPTLAGQTSMDFALQIAEEVQEAL